MIGKLAPYRNTGIRPDSRLSYTRLDLDKPKKAASIEAKGMSPIRYINASFINKEGYYEKFY